MPWQQIEQTEGTAPCLTPVRLPCNELRFVQFPSAACQWSAHVTDKTVSCTRLGDGLQEVLDQGRTEGEEKGALLYWSMMLLLEKGGTVSEGGCVDTHPTGLPSVCPCGPWPMPAPGTGMVSYDSKG